MKKMTKDEQIIKLQQQLAKLRKEEQELNGTARRSYETLKVFSLIVLLVCIIFQTCYIRDSLDLGAGSLAKSEVDSFNNDNKGPYDLDNNKTNTDDIKNNESKNLNQTGNINNKIANGTQNNENNIKNNNIIQNTISNNVEVNNVNINNKVTDNFTTEPITEQELKYIKIIQIPKEEGQSIKQDFNDLASLDIFQTVKYLDEKLIYPGITGEYRFNIENYTLKNISYKLTFSIENPKNVNIKFKLKRNGTYIVGNEEEYVTYDKLSQEELKLKTKMGDTYLLEWKWIEAANDNETTSKTERANYKVDIKGEAY